MPEVQCRPRETGAVGGRIAMPVSTTVKIRGNRKVMRGLRVVGDAIPRIGRTRIKTELRKAKTDITKYPAELPNQSYERTGIYGRSWQVIDNGGLSFRLVGEARQKGRDYTKWVSGLADGTSQARVHRGRWKKIQDMIDNALKRIVRFTTQDLRDVIRGVGLGL